MKIYLEEGFRVTRIILGFERKIFSRRDENMYFMSKENVLPALMLSIVITVNLKVWIIIWSVEI